MAGTKAEAEAKFLLVRARFEEARREFLLLQEAHRRGDLDLARQDRTRSAIRAVHDAAEQHRRAVAKVLPPGDSVGSAVRS